MAAGNELGWEDVTFKHCSCLSASALRVKNNLMIVTEQRGRKTAAELLLSLCRREHVSLQEAVNDVEQVITSAQSLYDVIPAEKNQHFFFSAGMVSGFAAIWSGSKRCKTFSARMRDSLFSHSEQRFVKSMLISASPVFKVHPPDRCGTSRGWLHNGISAQVCCSQPKAIPH